MPGLAPSTQWPPGVSGNPGGNVSAGKYIASYVNHFIGKNLEQIQEIAEDPARAVGQRIAARMIEGAMKDGWTASGKRFGADDLDRIMDRTEGRPTQAIEMKIETPRSAAELLAEAQAKFPGREPIEGEFQVLPAPGRDGEIPQIDNQEELLIPAPIQAAAHLAGKLKTNAAQAQKALDEGVGERRATSIALGTRKRKPASKKKMNRSPEQIAKDREYQRDYKRKKRAEAKDQQRQELGVVRPPKPADISTPPPAQTDTELF